QERLAEGAKVAAVAEAAGGNRDQLPPGRQQLHRRCQEAGVEVRGLYPYVPEQPARLGLAVDLAVGRVQDSAGERRGPLAGEQPVREEAHRARNEVALD